MSHESWVMNTEHRLPIINYQCQYPTMTTIIPQCWWLIVCFMVLKTHHYSSRPIKMRSSRHVHGAEHRKEALYPFKSSYSEPISPIAIMKFQSFSFWSARESLTNLAGELDDELDDAGLRIPHARWTVERPRDPLNLLWTFITVFLTLRDAIPRTLDFCDLGLAVTDLLGLELLLGLPTPNLPGLLLGLRTPNLPGLLLGLPTPNFPLGDLGLRRGVEQATASRLLWAFPRRKTGRGDWPRINVSSSSEKGRTFMTFMGERGCITFMGEWGAMDDVSHKSKAPSKARPLIKPKMLSDHSLKTTW